MRARMRIPFADRTRPQRALALALGAAVSLGLAATGRGQDPGPAVQVERVRLPRRSELGVGDGVATIARFDLRRLRLTFLTQRDGAARPLDRWVREHHLVAGINAGMFLPSGRPCGYVRLRGEVLSARRPTRFTGIVGFDPIAASDAAMGVGGPGCGGDLDAVAARYGSVLQSNRVLIDCEGRPTAWSTRRYSSAALGVDREGRAVMIHVRTPYRMAVLSRMLAAPAIDGHELGLRGLVYMEGGPEASLVVDSGRERVALMGSWEDGFHEADDLHTMWDLPNVVGVERR